MQTVTISPKYQIVIPKTIRDSLHLSPGEQLHVFSYENRLEFVPIRDVKKMRGFLKGMETDIQRDEDRV